MRSVHAALLVPILLSTPLPAQERKPEHLLRLSFIKVACAVEELPAKE